RNRGKAIVDRDGMHSSFAQAEKKSATRREFVSMRERARAASASRFRKATTESRSAGGGAQTSTRARGRPGPSVVSREASVQPQRSDARPQDFVRLLEEMSAGERVAAGGCFTPSAASR